MKRAAFIAAALLIGFGAMSAQAMLQLIVNFQGQAAAYSGPGDVVSGAFGWWGLRAYNASYATGVGNALTVSRPDTTTQNITVLSNGKLDIASANSFAGTDATCTGTISSTTLTVSSCSGTLHVFDTLTGTGINQPSWITVIGSCGTPPGTCTLNSAQTVSVAETITAQKVLNVTKAYDQSGANKCSSAACDLTVGVLAQLQLIPDCGNTLPCMHAVSNSSSLLSGTLTWPTQPITASWVMSTLATTGSTLAVMGASTNDFETGMQSGPQAYVYAGGANITVKAASDSARHAVQAVFNGPSSAVVSVDNAESTGNLATLNPTGGIYWGQNFSGSQFHGFLMELGVWGSALSGTNRTNMCHNQYGYWATATSC